MTISKLLEPFNFKLIKLSLCILVHFIKYPDSILIYCYINHPKCQLQKLKQKEDDLFEFPTVIAPNSTLSLQKYLQFF